MVKKLDGRVGRAAACLIALAGGTMSYAQTATKSEATARTGSAPAPAHAASASAGADRAAAPGSSGTQTEKTPAPAAQAAAVSVVVIKVQGHVGVRRVGSTGPRTILKGGEMLPEGVEFQIGFKSAVWIRVAAHQEFMFDQSGLIELRRALNDGEKNVTRIRVDSGRASFDVDSTKSRNDVKIETPEMTLAIKGTIGSVEVAPGFGTRASGDVENTGRIEVDWNTGERAVMTRSETTDSVVTDPAQNQNELASAETPKVDARDSDEKRLLKRTTSSKQDVELTVGKTKTPVPDMVLFPPTDPVDMPPVITPMPGEVLHFDPARGDLYGTTPGLNSAILRRSYPVDPGAALGGSAIRQDPTSSGAGKLVYLETSFPTSASVRNRLSEYALDRLNDEPTVLGQFTGDASQVPTLNGLGALGSTLYASGGVGDTHALFRVDLSAGELTTAMDLGTTFEGALGGSTSRGTLFAMIHDPGAGANDPLLGRAALVELDPRTNYLAAAYPGLTGSLGGGTDVSNSSGIDLASLQAFTGLAAFEGGVVVSGVSPDNGGRSVLMRYEMTGNNVNLTDVRALPETLTHGLASEAPGAVRVSTPLASPAGAVDRSTLSVAFAELGYSQQAMNSGLVERLVRRQVVMAAAHPEACDASAEIGHLRAHLMRHVAERAGVGRAVQEFRQTLPPMHPCEP